MENKDYDDDDDDDDMLRFFPNISSVPPFQRNYIISLYIVIFSCSLISIHGHVLSVFTSSPVSLLETTKHSVFLNSL